jgi:hypothetical protein
MGQVRTRQLQNIPFDANNLTQYKIESGKVCYYLRFTLSGAITCTDVNNTSANARRGDEWGLLKRLQLKLDDEVVNIAGDELWWLNRHWFSKNPAVSTVLGAGAGNANPAFSSTLILPFFMPRSFRPEDTLVHFGRTERPEITATWGTWTDVNASATGFTTAPTLRVQICEDEDRMEGVKFWKRYLLRREFDPTGANADFYAAMGVNRTYRRILVNSRNNAVPAADAGNIINRFKLYSGSVTYHESPWIDDREGTDLMGASPDNFVRAATAAGSYERIRQNALNSIDGWNMLDFSPAGKLSQCPDTYGLSQFGFNFDVSAAGKIVTIEESVEVPRATAVAATSKAA